MSPWCGWDSSRSRTHLVDSVVTCLLHTMYDSRVGLRGTMVSEAGGSRFSQAKSCRWSYWLFVDTSTSAWGTAAGRECVRCGTRLGSSLWVDGGGSELCVGGVVRALLALSPHSVLGVRRYIYLCAALGTGRMMGWVSVSCTVSTAGRTRALLPPSAFMEFS
jgi:hypothetical protein